MKVLIYTDWTGKSDTRPGCIDGLFIRKLEKIFLSALKDKNCIPVTVRDVEISLTCVDANKMAELNSGYREIDSPTDVLSFPLWEVDSSFIPPSDWEILPIGDIIVCPEIIAGNAAENGRGFDEELVLVISHGLLHLIGFDHDTEEREDEMWKEQDELVRAFFSVTDDHE